jgi:hypothetical protein
MLGLIRATLFTSIQLWPVMYPGSNCAWPSSVSGPGDALIFADPRRSARSCGYRGGAACTRRWRVAGPPVQISICGDGSAVGPDARIMPQ